MYIYSQDYRPVAELKPWQASIEDDSDPLSYVNKDRAQGKEVTTEAEQIYWILLIWLYQTAHYNGVY